MAFVSLICTALSLKKYQNALIEEKLEALKAEEDKSYKKKFKFRHIGIDIRAGFKKCFRKICRCSETSCGYKTCYKLGREGSCENYFLKSILGFIGGIFLTYFLYIFFIFQLNVKLTSATVICSILGCVLTVGLAFSSKVRCVVLLTLPQFFSKRGRQALMAYAFVLTLTGPAQNTLNNMGILSESLACGQEQLKQAVKQIIDVIKKPFVAIKEAIKKVVKTVREVVKKIKELLLKIKRVVMALVRVIKSVFEFLGKIINICNKELGTPYERCSRVFENAIADCNAKLGPLFSWLCSLTYIVKSVCYIVKMFDYVCMLVDFISDSVVGVVIRKVKTFVRHIKTMFYVRIKFSHSFQYQTTASKSITEIAKEIVAEIKDRSRGIVAFFNFMTSASMLFFIWLVFQVAYYRIKYLTNERFDNIYINKCFREIDQRRAKVGKETVLPLTKKEQQTYVPISSGGLARTERRSLSKSATVLATASIKLGTHLAADYSLYWILNLISYHARYQSKMQAPNFPVAHITGEGFLATLLRSIVDAFQPVGIKFEIDTVPCLPIPIPPDFDRYVQIGITILICWILTILEPYGLRFRNYIMGYYYPLRARQRTIWLYNHILRSRTSFLVLARRQLRKKFGMKGGSDEISCRELLKSKLNCWLFRICFGSQVQKTCLLCGEVFREKEKTRFIKCHTPGCPGLFCVECFSDLKNICPVCLSPIECGDLEDLDEEQDSSGDEPPPDKPKKKRKCRWSSCMKADDDEQGTLTKVQEEHEEPAHEEEEEEKEEASEDAVDKQAEESDSSTDYSYSYQYDERDTTDVPLPAPVEWRDVEMQAMPDEASMETFREGDEWSVDMHNEIKVPKDHVAMVRLDVVAEVEEDAKKSIDEDEELLVVTYEDVEKRNQLVNTEETQPLLDICTCSVSSSSSKRVEFIGVPKTVADYHKNVRRKIRNIQYTSECICSDIELAEENWPKSTMSTSTRSDCKYCRCPNIDILPTLAAGSETEEDLRNVVPKLDLSFLEHEENVCACVNPILSSRFSYVTYQEISETPSSSWNRSLESSSVLSSLQNSPASDLEDVSQLRRRHTNQTPPANLLKISQTKQRNVKTQYSIPEEDSPSSMDSYEFHKTQNRRIRQYYQATQQMRTDTRFQYRGKRRSISDMFKRLLPKRYRGQNYLPLHRLDVDDGVQIESYNYNQENWETLSIDTNPPTHAFDAQTSGSSDEEQQLLGGRRIRGGECTHLVNCRLIGRECPHKRKAKKSRAKLKDFSTLCLPPKPKPAYLRDLPSRYSFSIKDLNLTKPVESSMKSIEKPTKINSEQPGRNFTEKEDNSDYIIPKDAISALALGVDTTPPSSDSGLSEATCAALFGNSYPRELRKPSQAKTVHLKGEKKERDETLANTAENERLSKESKDKENSLKSQVSVKKSGSIDSQDLEQSHKQTEVNQRESLLEDELTITRSTTTEERRSKNSKESFKDKDGFQTNAKEGLSNINSTEIKPVRIQSDSKGSKKSVTSQISPANPELRPDNLIATQAVTTLPYRNSTSIGSFRENEIENSRPQQTEELSNTSQQGRSKRKSTQLNQLLYKDDKTEISLVQKLSPHEKIAKTKFVPTDQTYIAPNLTPSVKLKISLHNTIIPEEAPENNFEDLANQKRDRESFTMTSPKSRDKIVETQEIFPLHHDWVPRDQNNRVGKLILASDKTQQTSDNDIYRASTVQEKFPPRRERSSSVLSSAPSVHIRPRAPSSEAYYSNDLPEKDAVCKNNCKCSICRIMQIEEVYPDRGPMHPKIYEEVNCSCCKCTNAIVDHRTPTRSAFLGETHPNVSTNHPRTRNITYQVTAFLPSTTDTEIPELLPPPPPPPLRPSYVSRKSARRSGQQTRSPTGYRRNSSDPCPCCMKQLHSNLAGYSGDYSNPSTSYRSPLPHNIRGNNDPGYNSPYEQYDYPNPEYGLSGLPYQDNEDYLELVEELQDTLHTRNRNRVRRAMQEFEDRSKHNQPLEKPIIDYDETSESEEPLIRKIDQLRTNRKICCAEDKCSCGKKKELAQYSKPPKPTRDVREEKLAAEEKPSHWTMDPSSGEWYKGYNTHSQYRQGLKEREDFDQCTCNCERRYQ